MVSKKVKKPRLTDEELGRKLVNLAEEAFADTERTNAEKTWRELAKYVLPVDNGNFQSGSRVKGEVQSDAYDSTAQLACRDLASAMQSTITNPTTKWHGLRFRATELNNVSAVVEWLQRANEELYYSFADSNFNAQIGRLYQSLTALGTGVFLHEEKFEDGVYSGTNFIACPMGEVALEENHLGICDVLYRKYCLTAKKLVEKFGKESVGEDILAAYDKRSKEDFIVYHCIYPRDKDEIKYTTTGTADGKHRPFASCYVLEKGARLLRESGHHEQPFYAWRWAILPGEVYGFGPGHVARADVLTLNVLSRDILVGAARAIKPTYAVQENNLLTGDIRPNKIVVMRDVNQFKEMASTARMDIGFLEQKELKDNIKSAFYIDKLMLPPRTQTGEQTAYEIQQRLEQMQVVIGPVLSNINDDLSRLIMRQLNILMRNGVVPPPPKEVIEFAEQSGREPDLDIMYLNQLARSQQLADLRNLQSFAQEVSALAQSVQPSAIDKINVDAVVDEIARIRNISEAIINSDDEVQQVRQERAEQQQQQQMLQQGEQASNIAKNMGANNQGTIQ